MFFCESVDCCDDDVGGAGLGHLISPASRGVSHLSFCSSVPYFTRVSMLPVSGAWQLNTSGAYRERPITSQRWAYSRLVRPAPYLVEVVEVGVGDTTPLARIGLLW